MSWDQPVSFKYHFDSNYPAPSADYEQDFEWALGVWDSHFANWPLGAQEVTSNYTVLVRWRNQASIGATSAGGNPLKCTTSQPCVMTFDYPLTSPDVWETQGASLGIHEYDFRSTALHEIGHALGLGHSFASLRYNGDSWTSVFGSGYTNDEHVSRQVAMYDGAKLDDAGRTVALSKDDCASLSLQYFNIATCNRNMNYSWGSTPRAGIDSSSTTPLYYHGWGFSQGWQYRNTVGGSVRGGSTGTAIPAVLGMACPATTVIGG